ncbi:MAG: glycosyltransferase [Bacteroidota bacterium]
MIEELLIYLFFFCLSVQAVYHFIFISGFQSYKKPKVHSQKPVSVIICAHDEEENLKTLLPQLYCQEHAEFEVIVVEDRSNDGSYDFLLEESAKQPLLKMVKVRHKPEHISAKKFALTLGMKAAQYDTVLLTDADCVPNTNHWITNMTSCFEGETKIVLGFSNYKKLSGVLNAFIRFETLWTAIKYFGFALSGRPYMGVGRNLAYKKSLFLENKGFSDHSGVVGGDDDLFVNRHATKKNTKVILEAEASTTSVPKTTWKSYYKQKLRHVSVGKHYRWNTKILLGLLSLSQILIWPLFIGLLVQNPELYVVLASFLIRTLLMYLTFIFACKKLGVRFEIWALLFLDILLAFYYTITGMSALLTKRVRWN